MKNQRAFSERTGLLSIQIEGEHGHAPMQVIPPHSEEGFLIADGSHIKPGLSILNTLESAKTCEHPLLEQDPGDHRPPEFVLRVNRSIPIKIGHL